jgi:hypothetical protein
MQLANAQRLGCPAEGVALGLQTWSALMQLSAKQLAAALATSCAASALLLPPPWPLRKLEAASAWRAPATAGLAMPATAVNGDFASAKGLRRRSAAAGSPPSLPLQTLLETVSPPFTAAGLAELAGLLPPGLRGCCGCCAFQSARALAFWHTSARPSCADAVSLRWRIEMLASLRSVAPSALLKVEAAALPACSCRTSSFLAASAGLRECCRCGTPFMCQGGMWCGVQHGEISLQGPPERRQAPRQGVQVPGCMHHAAVMTSHTRVQHRSCTQRRPYLAISRAEVRPGQAEPHGHSAAASGGFQGLSSCGHRQ